MDKAADAFRTISEVAEAIGIPAHVLRFWESRFPQIKPVKRAGARRYYRPSDVALVTGIHQLLHIDGLTIREVQQVLRVQGVRHVAAVGGAKTADLDRAAAEALAPIAPLAARVEAKILPLTQPSHRAPSAPQQQVATIQSLFPLDPSPPPRDNRPPEPVAAPRKPRPPITRPMGSHVQPSQPFILKEDAPEAPHIWVEADKAADFDLLPLRPSQTMAAPMALMLAQMAAQLQPLREPAAGQTSPALRDLHDRLRLLHARMNQPPPQQS